MSDTVDGDQNQMLLDSDYETESESKTMEAILESPTDSHSQSSSVNLKNYDVLKDSFNFAIEGDTLKNYVQSKCHNRVLGDFYRVGFAMHGEKLYPIIQLDPCKMCPSLVRTINLFQDFVFDQKEIVLQHLYPDSSQVDFYGA